MIDTQLLKHLQTDLGSAVFTREDIESKFNSTRSQSNFISNHGGFIIDKLHNYHESLTNLDRTMRCNDNIGIIPAYDMINGDIVFSEKGVILARIHKNGNADFHYKGTVNSKISPTIHFTTVSVQACIRLVLFGMDKVYGNLK